MKRKRTKIKGQLKKNKKCSRKKNLHINVRVSLLPQLLCQQGQYINDLRSIFLGKLLFLQHHFPTVSFQFPDGVHSSGIASETPHSQPVVVLFPIQFAPFSVSPYLLIIIPYNHIFFQRSLHIVIWIIFAHLTSHFSMRRRCYITLISVRWSKLRPTININNISDPSATSNCNFCNDVPPSCSFSSLCRNLSA